MNLSDFLTHEADALEREFRDVTAPDRTPRSIRRVRAVRHGATAGVSVVAMGALVAGGVRLANWEQEEPGIGVAPSPNSVRAALIDPYSDSRFTPYAYAPACGAEAPVVSPTRDGFSLELHGQSTRTFDPLDSPDPYVYGDVTSTREGPIVASVSSVGLVWVQDDVVVGYSASPTSARYSSGGVGPGDLGPDTPARAYGELTAEVYRCDSPIQGPWKTIDAGTYQVYALVRVVGAIYGEEGDPNTLIDTGLVAPPITLTLTESWQDVGDRERELYPPTPLPQGLACGTVVPRDNYGYDSRFSVTFFVFDSRTPAVGERFDLAISTYRQISPTTLTVPESFEVWLMGPGRQGDNSENGSWTVIGRAWLEPVGSRDISFPQNWMSQPLFVTITEIDICDGDQPLEAVIGEVPIIWKDIEGSREVVFTLR